MMLVYMSLKDRLNKFSNQIGMLEKQKKIKSDYDGQKVKFYY
jgi:hypothetical protein